jgi:hypothetical protein
MTIENWEDEEDYKAVVEALQEFFGNTTRSKAETVDGMKELRGEIDMMLEALRHG